ncbi:hypothetical protein WN51_05669 [Melipona quadrifasciata]|uniref:Uncharacterized protein n=1 Tax=Melipona quadrifasciata TaxID=166423 RepID=A0A0M8ZV45_9HYME|nr:hypothetical protein WN51_05669 [Melipona quadrifasciata]
MDNNRKKEIKEGKSQNHRKRSTSLSDSSLVTKINRIEGMDTINPDIHTKNRFSIFAECLIKEPDNEKTNIKPLMGNLTAHKTLHLTQIHPTLRSDHPSLRNGSFHYWGDPNTKHPIWNNINRNANGSAIKNHSDLRDYQIIHNPIAQTTWIGPVKTRVDLEMHSSDLGPTAKADKHIKYNVKGRIPRQYFKPMESVSQYKLIDLVLTLSSRITNLEQICPSYGHENQQCKNVIHNQIQEGIPCSIITVAMTSRYYRANNYLESHQCIALRWKNAIESGTSRQGKVFLEPSLSARLEVLCSAPEQALDIIDTKADIAIASLATQHPATTTAKIGK